MIEETSPQAVADGIAFMFWVFVYMLAAALIVGPIVKYLCQPRTSRGPWRHLARVDRAKQQMAAEVQRS